AERLDALALAPVLADELLAQVVDFDGFHVLLLLQLQLERTRTRLPPGEPGRRAGFPVSAEEARQHRATEATRPPAKCATQLDPVRRCAYRGSRRRRRRFERQRGLRTPPEPGAFLLDREMEIRAMR